MTAHYVFLVLIIQGSLAYAYIHQVEKHEGTRDVLKKKPDIGDEVVKDVKEAKKDWMEMFLTPNDFYPTSSSTLMSQVANSNKSPEEQLEDIKEMANKITLAIQSEMANLLSYALNNCDKEGDDNALRKRRSPETPMDSSQLVMRLLKHIKSNNEYQNIAIEKMMTAQEIADKFGIKFNPDPEIISDLAVAANEQAKELSSILKDAGESKNATHECIEFVPLEKQKQPTAIKNGKVSNNNTYYMYAVHYPEQELVAKQRTYPSRENAPELHSAQPPVNHVHYNEPYSPYSFYYNYPYETQVMAPPTQQHYCSAPVSQKPNFYEPISFTQDYYSPYCSMEPITTTTTIVLPFEEPVEPEPELVGEEFDETVSSKVYVDRGEEPGSATVNHVMTYTVSEKAHLKTPQIERLPQQMQYCFFLI